MTERPILFSAPMVRAILEGRKTQTRRLIKPQPPTEATSAGVTATSRGGPTDLWSWLSGDPEDCDTWCPLGDFKTGYVQGMRLWVREACFAQSSPDGEGVAYPADRSWRIIDHTKEATEKWLDLLYYRRRNDNGYEGSTGKLVPPIHMPRWASRITLEVTEVKVERLQDISETDATAEGCRHHHDPAGDGQNVIEQFSYLWETIYGPNSWAANPWVAALTFRRVPQ